MRPGHACVSIAVAASVCSLVSVKSPADHRCAVRAGSTASHRRQGVGGRVRIGETYHVEPSLNRVTGPSGTTRLEPKVMLVLVCLAESAGEMVPKDRLLYSAWADTAVGDDVLTRAISELRPLFEDDPKQPRVIETIPKAGYRLIAPVASPQVDAVYPATPQAGRRSRHRWRFCRGTVVHVVSSLPPVR